MIKYINELEKFNVDINLVKALAPTHAQIMDLLEKVRQSKKTRIS